MKQNNEIYCRLECYYGSLLSNSEFITREKSLFYKNDNVYVKNFDSVDSLKQQIINSTQIWINKHDETERYLSDQEYEELGINFLNDKHRDKYPGFMIYNQSGKNSYLGYCYQGWFLLGNTFSKYLMKYAVNLYGIPDYGKHLRKITGRSFIFLIPDVHAVNSKDLLSDELINLELKYFFSNQLMPEEIQQKICYSEMRKRGYTEILNPK